MGRFGSCSGRWPLGLRWRRIGERYVRSAAAHGPDLERGQRRSLLHDDYLHDDDTGRRVKLIRIAGLERLVGNLGRRLVGSLGKRSFGVLGLVRLLGLGVVRLLDRRLRLGLVGGIGFVDLGIRRHILRGGGRIRRRRNLHQWWVVKLQPGQRRRGAVRQFGVLQAEPRRLLARSPRRPAGAQRT
ncbi:MAG: hypothetical protein ACR2IP_07445 [Solirubrobacteraceae bacterium]